MNSTHFSTMTPSRWRAVVWHKTSKKHISNILSEYFHLYSMLGTVYNCICGCKVCPSLCHDLEMADNTVEIISPSGSQIILLLVCL